MQIDRLTPEDIWYHKDVLYHIFSHLNIRDLGIIAQVCNAWKTVSESDEVWRKYQIYDDPTPAPIRKYTLMAMQQCFEFLKKAKTIPEDLPYYGVSCIFRAASEISTWETFRISSKGCIFKSSYSDVCLYQDTEGCEVMRLVVVAFDCYLHLHKIGFFSLTEVEGFIRKTGDVFYNPYPFQVLQAKYLQQGNLTKAKEMQETMISWEYDWF